MLLRLMDLTKEGQEQGLGLTRSLPFLKCKYLLNHCSFYAGKLLEVERKGRSVVLIQVLLHGSMRFAGGLIPLMGNAHFLLGFLFLPFLSYFSLSLPLFRNITNLTKTDLDLGLFSLFFFQLHRQNLFTGSFWYFYKAWILSTDATLLFLFYSS